MLSRCGWIGCHRQFMCVYDTYLIFIYNLHKYSNLIGSGHGVIDSMVGLLCHAAWVRFPLRPKIIPGCSTISQPSLDDGKLASGILRNSMGNRASKCVVQQSYVRNNVEVEIQVNVFEVLYL